MSFVISSEKGVSSMSGEVKINLRGVTSINSVGARKYLEFVASCRTLKITYEDCPDVMVNAFLMLPSLLGPAENTACILSLQIVYACPRCKEAHNLYVKAEDIKLKGKDLAFPIRVCPSCSGFLAVDPLAAQLTDLVEFGALSLKAKG